MGQVLLARLSDDDEHCRFWAAWSLARLGMNSWDVIEVLKGIATAGGPNWERALVIAIRCMPIGAAKGWQAQLSSDPRTLRLGVLAAGAIGDPLNIDALIGWMENPEVARVAGNSLSMITGADLGYEDLDADAPESIAEQPSDDSEDENVKPDPDEDLQWPAPDRVAAWWSKRGSDFASGVRYLNGEPITEQSIIRTLRKGTQRHRAAAALELAMLRPSEPLFEVRARGDRQLESLKRWTS
jgi:uncharacterized protein (TIGR02270 family)